MFIHWKIQFYKDVKFLKKSVYSMVLKIAGFVHMSAWRVCVYVCMHAGMTN